MGNVLATVSDKKIGHSSNGTVVDYYEADVISAQDYYPFGQLQPGRQYGIKGRYGFNGQEKSTEINSDGNLYTAEFWEYDSRIGRRWNVDPITKQYPWLTPYQFASNRPIDGIDLDGKEWSVSRSGNAVTFTVKIAVYNESGTLKTPKQLQKLVSNIETNIEGIFTKSVTASDGTTTNYKLDVQFDTKPPVAKADSKFKLILQDVTPKSEGPDGEVTYSGGRTKIGGTQENTLFGTLSVSGISSGDDLKIDYSTLIRSLTHEFGHSGGLPHVWDGSSPTDINQNQIALIKQQIQAGTVTKKAGKSMIKDLEKKLKSNLMNSAENTDPNLRTSDSRATNLTPGQLDKVEKTVTSQQPPKKE